jgi:small subunit ribosomal protein S6e
MAEFKLVIGDPKTKKTIQKEVKEEEAKIFLNKKIGDKVKGDSFNLPGYEFEIRGGSDACGFPMRKDLPGSTRKKILSVASLGIKTKFKGVKVRKTVAGNTIYDKTSQINLKILKEGKAPLVEKKEEEAPKEEKTE